MVLCQQEITICYVEWIGGRYVDNETQLDNQEVSHYKFTQDVAEEDQGSTAFCGLK